MVNSPEKNLKQSVKIEERVVTWLALSTTRVCTLALFFSFTDPEKKRSKASHLVQKLSKDPHIKSTSTRTVHLLLKATLPQHCYVHIWIQIIFSVLSDCHFNFFILNIMKRKMSIVSKVTNIFYFCLKVALRLWYLSNNTKVVIFGWKLTGK